MQQEQQDKVSGKFIAGNTMGKKFGIGNQLGGEKQRKLSEARHAKIIEAVGDGCSLSGASRVASIRAVASAEFAAPKRNAS